jgi:signal transduction histidine kinase
VGLAAGTTRFRVQFTAPSLRAPERQRFEYRMDGVDGRWLDAGTNRALSYTNIGPGDYRFRVRAVGPDGSAAGPEAALPISVAPTLLQSGWFRAACVAAALLLAALLYRYRVRYLTRRLAERLEVKTAERERIARTLHDSFLQTVHGLVLRVDALAAGLPEDDRTRHQLEHVLDDASQALGEGRERLQELRAGAADALDAALAGMIARLRDVHRATGDVPAADLHTEGEARPLLPAAAEEVAAIAHEALRNAFAHADAARVRVTLGYGRRALTLTVRDDGAGIDSAVLRAGGKAGHWGLVGMRERADRLGATLAVDSAPGRGTTVTLAVPAARAYAPG